MSYRFITHLDSLLNPIVCSMRRKPLGPHLTFRRNYIANSNKKLTYTISTVPHRKYWWGGIPKKPNEASLKIVDEIPEGFNLIYRNRTAQYVKWSYFITCMMSASVVAILLYTFDYQHNQVFLTSHKLEPFDNELLAYIVVFILIFYSVHSFIKKVPMRIYNMPLQKRYILIFNGDIPLTTKRVGCSIGEVSKFNYSKILSELLPWNDSGYLLKNSQKILLFEDSFRRPADLHILLGEQDPDCD